MPCVYELWPSADLSVPETQPNQGFANRALPVMYLSTANSGQWTERKIDGDGEAEGLLIVVVRICVLEGAPDD